VVRSWFEVACTTHKHSAAQYCYSNPYVRPSHARIAFKRLNLSSVNALYYPKNSRFSHTKGLSEIPVGHLYAVKRKCVDSKFWVETQLPPTFERCNTCDWCYSRSTDLL